MGTVGAQAATAAPIAPVSVSQPAPQGEFKALVFSKTAAFAHSSIDESVAAIKKLGADNGFLVDSTTDAADFTDANLAQYKTVIWLNTTGDVLDPTQQAAFEKYIQAGGGFAGVHAASDTEYDWPWYGELVGAYFKSHPVPQNASIKVEDPAHPSTSFLGDTWNRFDEWYDFKQSPRDKVHVLLSLDEKSYTGGTMGTDHPIAWCQAYDGGRSWFTGLGHTEDSYTEPAFLTHLLQGIRTTAGVEDADCSATQSSSYELVPLDTNTGNPMSLTVAPDRTVFYAERNGRVQRIDPVTQQVTTALNLPVTLGNEDGLLGLVLDPNFATNGWLYTYWSPSSTGNDGPHNRISRFTYDAQARTFSAASEKTMLKITTQRNECCHAGGDMVFDNDGNLILATGDNTNPFSSDGYVPIDERSGRSDFDAQGTSGNTNDLRGKIVRITPKADGTYSIPAGNLFAPGTAKTRSEIYAMGLRNPFRLGIDPYTGHVLVGEYGPDAGSSNNNRGPAATTEWNIIAQPGNYGWPYCAGVKCYNDYDFTTKQSGSKFDPNNLVNNSPNNTGLTSLPSVIKPTWWGEQGASDNPFPEIGNGSGYTGAPMGAPLYKFDPDLDSDVKWPAYWDNKTLFGDWNTGAIYSFQLNKDTSTNARNTKIVDVNRILPKIFDGTTNLYRAMDMQWGPDGALYVIDWGQGFGGDNASSGIYRVDYVQSNPSPIVRASSDVTNGAGSSLTVKFSSEGTRHPSGKAITLSWDFGDGSAKTSTPNPEHTYQGAGQYTATLTVTDSDGRTAIGTVNIVVGNAVPQVQIVFPESGGFFNWGDELAYKVIVTDPDATGPIDCSKVQVLPALGHDSHQHPAGELSGCEGTIPTGRDGGHGITSNIFWVVDVRYTDDGGQANVPLTGYATHVLNPKHLEAEFFKSTGTLATNDPSNTGVLTENTGDTGGGLNLSYVQPGDWWTYEPINFSGITGLRARLAVPNSNNAGKIELRWNSPTGTKIGEIPFTSTGGWQTYKYFDASLTTPLPTESGTLYFVLANGGVNVNYFDWQGQGVQGNTPPAVTLKVDSTSGVAPLVVNATATASDPDGGDVTVEWNEGKGTGFVAGGLTRQVTYDTPGVYTLTVRATDSKGGTSEQTAQITTVYPGDERCFSGRSDGFSGTALDTTRWNGVVRPSQDARVENGHLVLPATRTDLFGAGGNTPNIVLQNLPAGAFTATAKITTPIAAQYQQSGLIIYGDDDNYAKVVLSGYDSSGNRRVQFVREEAGKPNEVADSNKNVPSSFPSTYFVRFISDGTNLKAAYSADGRTFTEMPQTKQLAGITSPRIGLVALASTLAPETLVEAKVDWFHITPDDTASTGGTDDQFTGTSLDACRWNVINPNPSGYRVADGALQIDTTAQDIYQTPNGTVENFVVQNQPNGDWTVETKLDASSLDRAYQQAGLILRADDDNYVKIDYIATSSTGRSIEMRSEVNGAIQNPQPSVNGPANGIVWLRMAKVGDKINGSYSVNGSAWTSVTSAFANASAVTNGKIGLYALGNAAQGSVSKTAKFDYFTVVGAPVQSIAVSSTLDPSSPNGTEGWYTSPVTATISTTGGGASTVYREVKLDGAVSWSEYTTPVTVGTDGTHTLDYRASASGQSAVNGSVSFKIDRTAPASVAELDASSSPRTLKLSGTDATSGISRLEYRIGDGTWTAWTAPVVLTDAAQTVTHRAVDKAGNTSTEQTLQVAAVVAKPNVSASVSNRCVAGKMTQYIRIQSADPRELVVSVTSAYGTKSVTVPAGAERVVTISTRQPSLTAGTVEVTAKTSTDPTNTTTFTVESPAARCA